MSKRFGRNQRRQLREKLAAQEAELNLRANVEYRLEFSLTESQELLKIKTEQLGEALVQLRDAKVILGEHSPLFKAEKKEWNPAFCTFGEPFKVDSHIPIDPQARFEGHNPRPIDSYSVNQLWPMQMRVSPHPDRGEQHFLLEWKGQRWGYALSDGVVYGNTPAYAVTRAIMDAFMPMIHQSIVGMRKKA